MPIKVGSVKRRRGPADPRIQIDAGDLGAAGLAQNIRSGTAEVSEGLRDFGQGAATLANGIAQARQRVQNKKDDVLALEAENNVTVELTQALNQAKMDNQGSKAAGLQEILDGKIDEVVSRHTKGLSPGASNKAREAIEAIKLRARVNVANYQVDQLNKAEIQARQNKLDNAATLIKNDPSVSSYTLGRDLLYQELDNSSLPPEAKDALRLAISDKLGTAYFMGRQPAEAVAEFQAMKNNKLDPRRNAIYDNMSPEASEKLEKELQLRRKAYEVEKENQDKEYDDRLVAKVMNETYVEPEVREAKTKEGKRAIQTILANKGKEIDIQTRKQEYDTMLDKINNASDPRAITDAEIIANVKDGADASKLMSLKKAIVDETLNSVSYKEVINSLKDDLKAGKFGKKGTPEADIEYMKTLQAFETWSLQNKDKDALQYYQMLMDEKNKDYYDNFGFDRSLSPEDIKIARERIAEESGDRKLMDRATKLLTDNGKPVTDANIRAVMDYLRENPE